MLIHSLDCFFSQITLVDPTEKEQQCVSGHLVVACNKRKEVCALHQSSSFTINTITVGTFS